MREVVMDPLPLPAEFLSMAIFILLMLLNMNDALHCTATTVLEDKDMAEVSIADDDTENASQTAVAAMTSTLQNARFLHGMAFVEEDLGFWVRPHSTTWFSRFVVEEFDDRRWVQLFRMTKRSVFTLAKLLAPNIERKNTKYRLAIPLVVCVACSLFKLSHGASLLICSEMFAVGRSTVSIMLREVVNAVNVLLRGEISWPSREQALAIATDFKSMCGLPGVMGAIDCTHIAISKPSRLAADYFYFKSGGYTINCQAVVDSSKRFLDLYVGMPGSTNDARMLRRSTLFRRGQRNMLWDESISEEGFSPYLLGDAAYPILPWLMVPHRRHDSLPLAQALFNRKLSRGRAVVENAFGLMKMTFRELLRNCDLNLCIVPDVVTCCAILHNLLLRQSHEEVERLLEIVRLEEEEGRVEEEANATADGPERLVDEASTHEGQLKRSELGVYLALQRAMPL